MATDYLKKEPSKTEKMLYELAMQMHSMEKGLWSTSAHVVALGLVLGADPEKVAEILANGDEKIKEYSNKINAAVQKIEAKKHEGHDHAKQDSQNLFVDAAANPQNETGVESPESQQ